MWRVVTNLGDGKVRSPSTVPQGKEEIVYSGDALPWRCTTTPRRWRHTVIFDDVPEILWRIVTKNIEGDDIWLSSRMAFTRHSGGCHKQHMKQQQNGYSRDMCSTVQDTRFLTLFSVLTNASLQVSALQEWFRIAERSESFSVPIATLTFVFGTCVSPNSVKVGDSVDTHLCLPKTKTSDECLSRRTIIEWGESG